MHKWCTARRRRQAWKLSRRTGCHPETVKFNVNCTELSSIKILFNSTLPPVSVFCLCRIYNLSIRSCTNAFGSLLLPPTIAELIYLTMDVNTMLFTCFHVLKPSTWPSLTSHANHGWLLIIYEHTLGNLCTNSDYRN